MEQSMFDVKFVEYEGMRVGVCLGFSATSVHEQGIGQMAFKYDVNPLPWFSSDPISEARVKKTLDFDIEFIQIGNVSYLMRSMDVLVAKIDVRKMESSDLEKHFKEDYSTLIMDSPKNLRTSWGGSEFGIRVENDDGLLTQLYEAFKNHDVAMFERRNVRRDGRGLYLVIISKCSPNFLSELIHTGGI